MNCRDLVISYFNINFRKSESLCFSVFMKCKLNNNIFSGQH